MRKPHRREAEQQVFRLDACPPTMAEEEQILFRTILRGQGVTADGPIMVMHPGARRGCRRTQAFEGVDRRLRSAGEGMQHLARALARSSSAGDFAPRAHPSREQHPLPARASKMSRCALSGRDLSRGTARFQCGRARDERCARPAPQARNATPSVITRTRHSSCLSHLSLTH